jgi:hypothetical protein
MYTYDTKTRIHKLKLDLLREGGDYRFDAGTRMSWILHEYSDIMEPEPGINKEDDLRNMLKESGYYPKDIEEIVAEVYGDQNL